MIDHLQKLPPEIVKSFLETRDPVSLGIPEKLAHYILQINDASELHRKHHSITQCARKLQERYPSLSIHTCKSRIYDAINYLNDDCSVTEQSWYLYYADQFMKLFEVNLVAHDFREARSCLMKSCDYRIKASAGAVDPERVRFKPQIVSPDIELPRMGVKKRGLLEAYRSALTIVSSLETNDQEKARLQEEIERELGIEDANEEI